MAEVLKLAYGKPETIAFKFESGKEVQGRYGPQVAFSAVDRDGRDQILYLDPEPASDVEHKLGELGIRTREFFRIVKIKQPHGGTTINVERIAAPPMPATQAAASAPASHSNNAPAVDTRTAAAAPPPPPVRPYNGNTAVNGAPDPADRRAAMIAQLAERLAAAMCATIDAMIIAKAHAEKRGISLSNEDLRAVANTVYITESKR